MSRREVLRLGQPLSPEEQDAAAPATRSKTKAGKPTGTIGDRDALFRVPPHPAEEESTLPTEDDTADRVPSRAASEKALSARIVSSSVTGTTKSAAARRRLLEARAAKQRADLEAERLLRESQLQRDLTAAKQAGVEAQLQADLAEIEDEEEGEEDMDKESDCINDRNKDVEHWMEKVEQDKARPEYPAAIQVPGNRADSQQNNFADLTKALADVVRVASTSSAKMNGTSERLLGRLNIKDIAPFDGDPLDWLRFKNAYEVSTEMAAYTDKENVYRLQNYLKGEAREAVAPQMLMATSPASAMKTLELRFGRPEQIVRKITADLKKFPRLTGAYSEVVTLATKVQNTVTVIEATGEMGYLYNIELFEEIIAKLTESLKQGWLAYYELQPSGPKLPALAKFLMREAERACKAGVMEKESPPEAKSTAANKFTPASKFTVKQDKPGRGAALAVQEVTGATNDKPRVKRCGYCSKEGHLLFSCDTFKAKTADERWDYAREKNLCFRCLASNHRILLCKFRGKCRACGREHHTLLHKNVEPAKTVGHVHGSNETVWLKVLPVRIEGPRGTVKSYALLDEGASLTMIDKQLAESIGISGPEQQLQLKGVMGKATSCTSRITPLLLHGPDGSIHHIQAARMVDGMELPCQTVSREFLQQYEHLRDLPIQGYHGRPKILIGQDHWPLIVTRELKEGRSNEPVASRTNLGWVFHGCGSTATKKMDFVCHLTNDDVGDEDLHELVKKQFNIEAMGIRRVDRVSKADQEALHILERSTKREDGRWEAGLLWRGDINFPDNRQQAERRLRQIEKKMDADAAFAEEYIKQMDNLFAKGYAERENETTSKRKWYLPHFGVRNPNKPAKLRLVFDAATTYGGMSLNDTLHTGPTLLNSLLGVLMRFREGRVAVTADIKEMFLQIKIREEDRPAQSFLWRGSDRKKPPSTYQMSSMIFGATSSPSTAIYILNRNAEESGCSSRALEAVTRRHYVDDYLDSFATEEEAKRITAEVTSVHAGGGFELTAWASNKPEVLPSGTTQSNHIQLGQSDIERTLGLLWSQTEDSLGFDVSLKRVKDETREGMEPPTKREMLSIVMSCFDPLGLLAPFTLRGRILLQDVWRSGIQWDERLHTKAHETWQVWLEDLKKLGDFRISRWYEITTPAELHIFVDASAEAYAAVAYLRTSEGVVSFVAAKSRVAPLKATTIPRLELQAALMGSRLAATIGQELDLPIKRRVFWTDSRTVWCWIRGEPRQYNQFVSHRLGEIEELTKRDEWRWIPGELNVADEATRSSHRADLTEQGRWLRGPEFLRSHEEEWPQVPADENYYDDIEGANIAVLVKDSGLIDMERFSQFRRAVAALSYAMLFIEKSAKAKTEMRPELMELATRLIILQAQRESFAQDMEDLEKGKQVSRSSALAKLTPTLDKFGCLRVSGRIQAVTDVPLETKKPLILDRRHRVSQLLVEEEHRKLGHQSRETLVNELRQRYWIIGLRGLVRQVINKCVTCRRLRASAPQPRMGDLPIQRLQHHTRPFTFCGIDLYGPVEVAIGRRREKRWVALFTCLTIRAVHLELVHTLTTDSTLMALRRMGARRGYPRLVYTDNGTNFIGARNELAKAAQLIYKDPRLAREMASKGTEWKTIPPAAPHMGGAWERLVRTVKTALTTTLRERAPREEVLITLMAEAEAVVNSRPLTHVTTDPEDEEALTPNHFLLGSSSVLPRQGVFSDADLVMRRQWRISQRLADIFWRRWVREYLPTLQQRHKWATDRGPEVSTDDLVIIADNNAPRNMWLRGRVVGLHPGADGRVRVADVATKGGVLQRPVSKLVVLHHGAAAEAAGGGDCNGRQ